MESSRQEKIDRYPGSVTQEKIQENYSKLGTRLCTMKKQKRISEDFKSLGNVSSSRSYYFKESEKCKEAAILFLEHFWSKQRNYDATIENHRNKHKTSNTPQTPSFTTCISFMHLTIQEHSKEKKKKVSMVAISISGDISQSPKFFELIKSSINELNKSQKEFEYILLTWHQKFYNQLIAKVDGDPSKNMNKQCAEKRFGSLLVKLFGIPEINVYVNGIVNCTFYPYLKEQHYGREENSIDSHQQLSSQIQNQGFYTSISKTIVIHL